MSDILILALSSGEHLVAQVDEQGGAYVCTDVLQIMTQEDPTNGSVRMCLAPYMPYADQSGGLAVPTMMASVAIPSADLLSHYSERFGLVYAPPAPKIILG